MRIHHVVLLGLTLTTACGGSSTPTAVSNATPTPAATATATPAPSATPNTFAAACGSPLPSISDMYGFGIKVQLEPSMRKKILNANPYVRNVTYCASVGLGGNFCETRVETDSHRVSCDNYLAGISDEGGPGPTWYQEVNGRRLRCPGDKTPGDAPGCNLKAENQYLLDVYQPGKYIACGGAGSNGSCGECILEADEYDTPKEWIGSRRPGLCQVE
jgi:hypothetical protein